MAGVGKIAEADVIAKLHAVLAMLFIAYAPLGEMIHLLLNYAYSLETPTKFYGYIAKDILAKWRSEEKRQFFEKVFHSLLGNPTI